MDLDTDGRVPGNLARVGCEELLTIGDAVVTTTYMALPPSRSLDGTALTRDRR
jgi:hypothetical protein